MRQSVLVLIMACLVFSAVLTSESANLVPVKPKVAAPAKTAAPVKKTAAKPQANKASVPTINEANPTGLDVPIIKAFYKQFGQFNKDARETIDRWENAVKVGDAMNQYIQERLVTMKGLVNSVDGDSKASAEVHDHVAKLLAGATNGKTPKAKATKARRLKKSNVDAMLANAGNLMKKANSEMSIKPKSKKYRRRRALKASKKKSSRLEAEMNGYKKASHKKNMKKRALKKTAMKKKAMKKRALKKRAMKKNNGMTKEDFEALNNEEEPGRASQRNLEKNGSKSKNQKIEDKATKQTNKLEAQSKKLKADTKKDYAKHGNNSAPEKLNKNDGSREPKNKDDGSRRHKKANDKDFKKLANKKKQGGMVPPPSKDPNAPKDESSQKPGKAPQPKAQKKPKAALKKPKAAPKKPKAAPKKPKAPKQSSSTLGKQIEIIHSSNPNAFRANLKIIKHLIETSEKNNFDVKRSAKRTTVVKKIWAGTDKDLNESLKNKYQLLKMVRKLRKQAKFIFAKLEDGLETVTAVKE